METVVALGKIFLSFIAGIGIEKVRQSLLDNMSERNTFYSALSTNINLIQHKLDLLMSEPYKTSLIFLKMGLSSNDEANLETAIHESIRAFNLANNVKEKYQSMMISIISTILRYENPQPKCRILLDEFIGDKVIQKLFQYLSQKKYNPQREKYVQSGWFLLLNLLIGIPYVIAIYIPVNVTYVPHIKVSWDSQCRIQEDRIGAKGCSNRAYHIDHQLVLADMEDELDDLKYIIMFLNMMGNIFNIDKLRINEEFSWVAQSPDHVLEEKSYSPRNCVSYTTTNLKLMI